MAKILNDYRFKKIEILKNQELGNGSYGAVCKAMCDELLCAAKMLHPVLVSDWNVQKFHQECELMGVLKHPNIIQYLGTHSEGRNCHVFLMELMKESLTAFLERSTPPLPFHTQVNLCHDIALALAYLHSNDIIHRDLSSNNVLLTGDKRAKVTDFGMSRLTDSNQQLSTYTQAPGCVVYMSPEALEDTPKYSSKLDIFSLGVLITQILTCKFPSPGPPRKKVSDPKYGPLPIEVPVKEIERRKAHIDLIEPTHPLLRFINTCLSYEAKDRPIAQDICSDMSELEKSNQYLTARQDDEEALVKCQLQKIAELAKRDKVISKKDEEIAKWKAENVRKDEMLLHKDEELTKMGELLRKKDDELAKKEKEISLLEAKLKSSLEDSRAQLMKTENEFEALKLRENMNVLQSQSSESTGTNGVLTIECIALYDFSARSDSEISFRKGDHMWVIETAFDSNWWDGFHQGRRGFIPISYVEILNVPQPPLPMSSLCGKEDSKGKEGGDVGRAREEPLKESIFEESSATLTNRARDRAWTTSTAHLEQPSRGEQIDQAPLPPFFVQEPSATTTTTTTTPIVVSCTRKPFIPVDTSEHNVSLPGKLPDVPLLPQVGAESRGVEVMKIERPLFIALEAPKGEGKKVAMPIKDTPTKTLLPPMVKENTSTFMGQKTLDYKQEEPAKDEHPLGLSKQCPTQSASILLGKENLSTSTFTGSTRPKRQKLPRPASTLTDLSTQIMITPHKGVVSPPVKPKPCSSAAPPSAPSTTTFTLSSEPPPPGTHHATGTSPLRHSSTMLMPTNPQPTKVMDSSQKKEKPLPPPTTKRSRPGDKNTDMLCADLQARVAIKKLPSTDEEVQNP